MPPVTLVCSCQIGPSFSLAAASAAMCPPASRAPGSLHQASWLPTVRSLPLSVPAWQRAPGSGHPVRVRWLPLVRPLPISVPAWQQGARQRAPGSGHPVRVRWLLLVHPLPPSVPAWPPAPHRQSVFTGCRVPPSLRPWSPAHSLRARAMYRQPCRSTSKRSSRLPLRMSSSAFQPALMMRFRTTPGASYSSIRCTVRP